MRKILPVCIVGVLLLSGSGAVALNSDIGEFETIDCETSENQNLAATHTVLAEYGTATWCGYCNYAHAGLKNIYASGDYEFYYVSLVRDKNPTVVDPRLFSELNLYGYPTVYFDGGYRVNVGGSTGSESVYRSSISTCSKRSVYDVDINLDVTWLGGTEMQIDCSVQNNEPNTYDGTVRVYITEIESSKNWKDTAGFLYTFPLLDYAFKDDGTGVNVSIPTSGSWSDSTTWEGSAHGHSSITEDNIMVIAAVFNDEPHLKYSYPPSTNPFNAYYIDDGIKIPIYAILPYMDVHVTEDSTTVLEAEQIGVPSVVTHHSGTIFYKRQIESGSVVFADTNDNLISSIKKFGKRGEQTRSYEMEMSNQALDLLFSLVHENQERRNSGNTGFLSGLN